MEKRKILIVDDDANIAELIALYLTKECFQCEIAEDGETALEKHQSFQPDLILLDIMLPGIDGYAVLREIRKQYTTPVFTPVRQPAGKSGFRCQRRAKRCRNLRWSCYQPCKLFRNRPRKTN